MKCCLNHYVLLFYIEDKRHHYRWSRMECNKWQETGKKLKSTSSISTCLSGFDLEWREYLRWFQPCIIYKTKLLTFIVNGQPIRFNFVSFALQSWSLDIDFLLAGIVPSCCCILVASQVKLVWYIALCLTSRYWNSISLFQLIKVTK